MARVDQLSDVGLLTLLGAGVGQNFGLAVLVELSHRQSRRAVPELGTGEETGVTLTNCEGVFPLLRYFYEEDTSAKPSCCRGHLYIGVEVPRRYLSDLENLEVGHHVPDAHPEGSMLDTALFIPYRST